MWSLAVASVWCSYMPALSWEPAGSAFCLSDRSWGCLSKALLLHSTLSHYVRKRCVVLPILLPSGQQLFFCFPRSHVKKLAQQICHLRSPPIGDYCVSPPPLYSPEFFIFSILKETIMETLSSWKRLQSRGISKVLFPAFIQFGNFFKNNSEIKTN